MSEEKTTLQEQFNPDAFASEEDFCSAVLDADLNPIEKMKILSYDSKKAVDIVAEILKYAPYLENYIEDKEVFSTGEHVRDFIGGYWERFDALAVCDNELRKDEHRELYRANKRYSLDVGTAITFVGLYEKMEELFVDYNCPNKQAVIAYCNEMMTWVEICAVYFKETRTKEQNDIVYYRFGQKGYLERYFDVLNESKQVPAEDAQAAEENAPMPEEDNVEEDDEEVVTKEEAVTEEAEAKSQPSAVTSKGMSFPKKCMLICGGVFVVSLLLALIIKGALGNILLLLSGLFDIIFAVVLSKKAEKQKNTICPECGGTLECHRKFLRTTESEKRFERNPNKTSDESIYAIHSYTHHYLSTYTCTACKHQMQKETTDGGGCLTQYYSGRIKNTRSEPREF